MLINIIHHDRCFDGAASAALLGRFLQDYYYPNGLFRFKGVLHRPNFDWSGADFDGDENAIVDFRYSADSRVTWWFDHHQSAFLSSADRSHFEATHTRNKVLAPAYTSCAALIADHLRCSFGYIAVELDDLVRWADTIDGAKYATPEAAVDLTTPASRLRLVIEHAEDRSVRDHIVRAMRYRQLPDILMDNKVKPLAERYAAEHLDMIGQLSDRIQRRGRVALVDLTGSPFQRYHKMMPYMMMAEVDYAVALLRWGDTIKVSLGSNPWSGARNLVNLATLAERFGGGGHHAVAGITIDAHEAGKAQAMVGEIVEILTAAPTQPATQPA